MRRRRRSFFGFPNLANLGCSGYLLLLGVAAGPEDPVPATRLGEAAGYGARELVGLGEAAGYGARVFEGLGLGTGGRVTTPWCGDGS
jgi:hypothetical protein